MRKKTLDNDTFIRENLGGLVKRYAHQRIVICEGKIFTGPDAVREARKTYPKSIPLSFPVPGDEEFMHIL